MTDQMASLNPTHVDTVRAEMDSKHGTQGAIVDRTLRIMDELLGDRDTVIRTGSVILSEARKLLSSDSGRDANRFARLLDEYEIAHDRLQRILGAIEALDAVYDAAGAWSRFWLVPDGHVHRSENCQTLHREGKRTRLNWLPELAGHDEAEAIEEFGEKICTVCIPSAPTNPAFNGPGRRDRAEAESKVVEKAAKQAEADVKGITNPDGTPVILKGDGFTDTPKTLIAAQRLLSNRLGNVDWYRTVNALEGRDQAHPSEPGWLADAEILITAIAHKTDRDADEIRKEYQDKAAKKTARDLKR